MSTVTTIARPYARAAFEVALEQGHLDDWAAALDFAAAVANDVRVTLLLGNPGVDKRALRALFAPDGASPAGVEQFLRLLSENDRLAALPEITRLFTQLKDAAEETLKVTVRSASKLDQAFRKRLKDSLGKRFGRTIELDCQLDASIIGGAVIQAGDHVIDGSLSSKLQRMAGALAGSTTTTSAARHAVADKG